MSVVNQMLRDLDRRHAAGGRVFGQHLRSAPRSRRLGWVLLAGCAFVAAGAIAFALRSVKVDYKAPSPQAVPVTLAAAPVAAPPPAAAAAPAAVPLPVAAAEPTAPAAAPLPVAAAEPTAPAAPSLPVAAAEVTPTATATPVPIAAVVPPPIAVDRAVAKAPESVATSAREAASRSAKVGVAAESRAAVAAIAPALTVDPPAGSIDKRFRENPGRTADAELKRAAGLIEQGRLEEARAALQAAIALDSRHEGARQTLAVLLIEAGAMDDAEALLAAGLELNPAQANFALVLARLKLERGDAATALALLRAHGGVAVTNPEYRAFIAALLQRLGRHEEAIAEYQAVLKLAPGVGVWWIGLGLSQEAADRTKDAVEAFRRAKASGTLSADLLQFVERKLQTPR